jgi:hypothetical protein
VRLGDAGLDAEYGQTRAVAEIEEDPGVTRTEIHPEDLRPLQLTRTSEIDDSDAVLVGDDLGPAQQHQHAEEDQGGEDETAPLRRAQLLQQQRYGSDHSEHRRAHRQQDDPGTRRPEDDG